MTIPRIMVLIYREDDPSKNTALKLIRMNLAVRVGKSSVHGSPVVLNPYAEEYVGPWLHSHVSQHGVLVVDASWKKLTPSKFKGIRGLHARLPPLLPGNPINYAKPCILSSIEAIAATLYITGFKDLYEKLLGVYKWMNTFDTLNKELLEEYSKAQTREDMERVILEYWGTLDPCIHTVKTEGAET